MRTGDSVPLPQNLRGCRAANLCWRCVVTAVPVSGLKNGVRNIIPMLHLTRTWNSVTAVSFMRRGLALAAADDYIQTVRGAGYRFSTRNA